MFLLTPISGIINIVLTCSIFILDYVEAVFKASIFKPRTETDSGQLSPTSSMSNAECPSPSTSTNEMKRIKLLLDIMISPGGSRVVNVSTKDVMDVSRPSIFTFLLSWFAILVVSFIQMTKRSLLWLNFNLTGTLVTESSKSPLNNVHRITKSPKRRISHYRRLVAGFPFKIASLTGKQQFDEFHLSEPQDQESEAANTSLNNSKSQAEKRKRSVDEDSRPSSEMCSSDGEETQTVQYDPPKTPISDIAENPSHSEVDNDTDDHDELEIQDESSDKNSYQPSSSMTQRLLDITEEEYESAEDPDYEVPQQIDSSIDSSISSADEPNSSDSDAENEVNDLRAEALLDLAMNEAVGIESPEVPDEPLADNPRQVPENIDRQELVLDENQDQHNEPEYTNGQASMRELTNRNPQLRQFYGSESGASSPFSFNPSEPSVPNTPRSFASDSSHFETP